MNDVRIERGSYGPRAVLTGPWHGGLEAHLKAQGAVELELNYAKGWRGDNVEFLELLPDLRAFTILDWKIESVATIHILRKLLQLSVQTYCRTPIDFSSFPELVECSLEWRARSESLFACSTLTRLFVNRCTKTTFEPFSRLERLENLIILGGPLRSLQGIGALRHLNHLRLGNLRSLDSLSGLEEVTSLTELEIQTCKRIRDISAVGKLKNLRKLLLNECGDIDSLAPVAGLDDLEMVLFYGSTNIVDGDLSPLGRLPKLGSITFQDRRHYSHRREEFGSAYWGGAASSGEGDR